MEALFLFFLFSSFLKKVRGKKKGEGFLFIFLKGGRGEKEVFLF